MKLIINKCISMLLLFCLNKKGNPCRLFYFIWTLFFLFETFTLLLLHGTSSEMGRACILLWACDRDVGKTFFILNRTKQKSRQPRSKSCCAFVENQISCCFNEIFSCRTVNTRQTSFDGALGQLLLVSVLCFAVAPVSFRCKISNKSTFCCFDRFKL